MAFFAPGTSWSPCQITPSQSSKMVSTSSSISRVKPPFDPSTYVRERGCFVARGFEDDDDVNDDDNRRRPIFLSFWKHPHFFFDDDDDGNDDAPRVVVVVVR